MKRTSMILTIAAVVSISQATRLQIKSTTQLAHPTYDKQILVETAAAVLFGGDEEQFAQAADQALNQITFDFNAIKNKIKDKALQLIREQAAKIMGGQQQQQAAVHAQLDQDVARYILSEIAAGNPKFMQAFAEVSVSGTVAAEAQSDTQMFDWLRNLFGKKQQAEDQKDKKAAQEAQEQIEAQVVSYIRSQGQQVFEDLNGMIVRAQSVIDETVEGNNNDDDDDDDDDFNDAQITDAVHNYILSQSLDQSTAQFDAWFAQLSTEERSQFESLKDKLKRQILMKIEQLKQQGLDKLKGAIGQNAYNALSKIAKPLIEKSPVFNQFQNDVNGYKDAGNHNQAPAPAQQNAAESISAALIKVRNH